MNDSPLLLSLIGRDEVSLLTLNAGSQKRILGSCTLETETQKFTYQALSKGPP